MTHRTSGPRREGALPPPRKRLGQHFLRDAAALDAIADALGDVSERTVLEIGPGRGALTERLVRRARQVVAVELDRVLAEHLRERYAHDAHVRIVQGDVLHVNLADVAGGAFVLAGNVPYYITTPILFHALERPRPDVAVYLVQKEVAERMIAPPGSKTYGALSVNVQAVAHVELLRQVPPGAFNPPPSVDSAVIRVVPRTDPVIAPEFEDRYRGFVLAAFGLRRKQLGRVLRTILSIGPEEAVALAEACGLAADARPEVLSPSDFARLVAAIVRREAAMGNSPP